MINLNSEPKQSSHGMSFPNKEQAAVIEAVNDSLLVLAPMGTGKTRTAAAAIRRAIESGIEPERILGLTFTNRAAEAMRDAVAETLPLVSHRVHLFNIHGLCARFLREENLCADLPPDFGILDEDEAAELLWQFIPQVDRQERYKNKSKEALNAYEKFVVNFLLGKEVGPTPAAFRMYRDALHRDGSVDFTGLIARSYRVLKTSVESRERWQGRYQWMLVDEVQDINLAEYRMIAMLGDRHRCIKFFGDHHQTIYEWRFAQPREVLETFEKEFHPRKQSLKVNYRCSQKLVLLTNAVRKAFIPSQEPFPEATQEFEGGKLLLNIFETNAAEVEGLVAQIGKWRGSNISLSQIAVLARNNRTLIEISQAFKGAQIPHLIAEDFDFFRRQEVKDVTAVLEHLVCPFRRHPIVRLLKRFGAQAGVIDALEKATQGTGLHLGYLVRGAPGDPLQKLLESWSNRKVVALDTETTALDPLKAEIIQFAKILSTAIKGSKGADGAAPSTFGVEGSALASPLAVATKRFDVVEKPIAERGPSAPQPIDSFVNSHIYSDWIRPNGKVGTSVHTHGFTDEFLAANGKDARQVLEKGLQFEPDQILLGHNLSFDLRMIRTVCSRLGLEVKLPIYFDTMPLAAAVLKKEQLSGLRLETVAKSLGVDLSHAHDAKADAQACLSILECLMPQLIETQETRIQILAHLRSDLALAFRRVTGLFRQAAEIETGEKSLSELILEIWKLLCETSGLHDYKSNLSRTKNIEELAAIACFLEERNGGHLSLPNFLEQVTLSRRDMMLEVDPDRVRLLSAHAAKGLEFEAVALPRLITPWPAYSDEEARIFYVMLTRAKRHLWMSWPKMITTQWGKEVQGEPLKYLSATDGMLD